MTPNKLNCCVSVFLLFFPAFCLAGGQSKKDITHGLDQVNAKHVQHTTIGGRVELENRVTRQIVHSSLNFEVTNSRSQHPGIPTLSIDLTTTDTTLYEWKYNHINDVPVTGEQGFGLRSHDFDGNGRGEVYGNYSSELVEGVMIYELIHNNWQHRFTYTLSPGLIGLALDNIADLDDDGLWEIYGINATTLYSFEQEVENSFPTVPRLEFVGLSGYSIPTVLWDMHGDATKELVYRSYKKNSTVREIQANSIAEYDSALGTFNEIWSEQLPPGCFDVYCSGNIAAGDHDLDGAQDFVTSSFMGNVFVVESVLSDSFTVVWADSLDSAGRVASGDVDGNGIPEFFVGGNIPESDGYVHARIHAYERSADNSFEPFFELNIFPVGSFFVDLYQTEDIDGDGQEELLLSFQGANLIIQGDGPRQYRLFYYKPISASDGFSAGDVTNDGVPELFMSRFYLDKDGLYSHTEVYELDTTLVSVAHAELPYDSKLALSVNYPNPFNSSTQIAFELGRDGLVNLSVLDLLGRTVAVLVDESLHRGRYNVVWNGKGEDNQPLTSGVYFASVVWNGKRLTRKMVLLR